MGGRRCDRGIAHSDSVNGVFPDIRTNDGSKWQPIAHMPPALPGEASFSSSGTCITTEGFQNAWIATGGASLTIAPMPTGITAATGDVGLTVVPGGVYAGKSFFEVAALGTEGIRWFAVVLARSSEDDWMRRLVERFAEERLPDLWQRYSVWRQTVATMA